MIAAIVSLAVAALTAGLAAYRPGWWSAAVSLAVLGGITVMIYAVNIRIVPVFARRAWPGERGLRVQIALAAIGAWTVYAGRLAGLAAVVTLGSALALAGALAFAANMARLFRQPTKGPAPPLPQPEQAEIDVVATRFIRMASGYLLLGLGLGVVLSQWRPAVGRWDLVWAHALLVGFFLSTAFGVSYHIMARWTGRRWRSAAPIRVHFWLVAIGLPFMLVALATDQTALFAVAGPLQAAAIVLAIATIAPLAAGLPGPTRAAVVIAAVFLLIGVAFGAAFAIDPMVGARYRLLHAGVNLFGWTGLLISGIGYYLVPRFAGQPLRWPRLATVQIALLTFGIALWVLVRLAIAQGGALAWALVAAQLLVAAGFLLLAVVVAGTFRRRRRGTTAALPIAPRP
jgi:hypothetical protein